MANPKGNAQNFTKKGRLQDLPTTERQEIARKGAEKSNQVQKEKRDWANIAEMFLTHKASESNIKKIKKLYPNLDESRIDIMATISSKLVSQAVNGDIRSVEFLRDTAFGKPVQTIKQTNRNIDGATIDDEGNQEA
jgi:hypothetical protein